jgi:hypothetical protein
MDHFISMYIDDELSLAEKVSFINEIHRSKDYKDEAVTLLEQEKQLGAALVRSAPPAANFSPSTDLPLRSIGLALAAGLLIALSFLAGLNLGNLTEMERNSTAMTPTAAQHRFVILEQESNSVEITGSFTNWQKIPLMRTGQEGYWEIMLDLPAGEHRYTFILDGSRLLPDPTVATREPDDFGAINSIISVQG